MDSQSGSSRLFDLPQAGVLDVSSALDLQRTLLPLADSGASLDLNLAAVTEIDASAVQLFVALERALAARGHSLQLKATTDEVRAALTRAGVARLIAPTEEKRP